MDKSPSLTTSQSSLRLYPSLLLLLPQSLNGPRGFSLVTWAEDHGQRRLLNFRTVISRMYSYVQK